MEEEKWSAASAYISTAYQSATSNFFPRQYAQEVPTLQLKVGFHRNEEIGSLNGLQRLKDSAISEWEKLYPCDFSVSIHNWTT